jgi:hypothetical protein
MVRFLTHPLGMKYLRKTSRLYKSDGLYSGTLALSTGFVRDPDGKVTGRFNSIWRLEGPRMWRVVFDKGSPVVPAERSAAAGAH